MYEDVKTNHFIRYGHPTKHKEPETPAKTVNRPLSGGNKFHRTDI